MGNVYGIASPGALPATFNPTGDIVCNAGVSTTVIATGLISGPTPGDYYPAVWVMCAILLGGTAPSNLRININMGGGALDWYDWPVALLTPAATVIGTIALFGPNSGSQWVPPGSNLNIGINPTAQGVTFKLLGSGARVLLMRGADA